MNIAGGVQVAERTKGAAGPWRERRARSSKADRGIERDGEDGRGGDGYTRQKASGEEGGYRGV